MSITSQAIRLTRGALRRVGLDVVRYPSPRREPVAAFLRQFEIETVVDVGANVGQYARALRQFYGFDGQIISIEPDPDTFAELARAASRDPKWEVSCVAFGDTNGLRELGVSGLSVFNSFLPVSESTTHRDPRAATVRSVTVTSTTADAWWRDYAPAGPTLLKIDAQGFEKQILEGAAETLTKIAGLQLELSLSPLYEGQPLIEDVLPLLRGAGFALYEVWSGYMDVQSGAVLELDGLFFRDAS